jgi:AcrR family transcriptional regulator
MGEQNLEERRSDVIKAAFEHFTQKGFSRAQVTQIAEQSHVSTATIYKLFPSKEALFVEAYEHGLDLLADFALQWSTYPDAQEGLRYVARRYAALLDSPLTRRVVRMQIAQNSEPAGPGRTTGYRMRALVEAAFSPILTRCQAEGIFQIGTIEKAHALLTGFIEHQTLIYGLIIDEQRVADFAGDLVADEAVRVALLAYGTERAQASGHVAALI